MLNPGDNRRVGGEMTCLSTALITYQTTLQEILKLTVVPTNIINHNGLATCLLRAISTEILCPDPKDKLEVENRT